MKRRYIKYLVVVTTSAIAASILVWGLGARPPAPTPSSGPSPTSATSVVPAAFLQGSSSPTQPKITWSDNQLEVILSPGESSSKNLAFKSDKALQNALIEAVPEIAGFLTIQPNSFAAVPGNQQQSVRLAFAIPQTAPLGTFEGTIHLRIGTQTLPQTLKVSINVWRAFSSVQGGYTLKFPPEFEISSASDSQNLGLLSPATKAARDANAIEAYDDISVVVVDNVQSLGISQFVERYDDGWFTNYRSKTGTTINGRSAARYSDVGASVGHAPMIAVFIDGGSRIFIFTINLYESSDSAYLIPIFDDIVSAFKVQ